MIRRVLSRKRSFRECGSGVERRRFPPLFGGGRFPAWIATAAICLGVAGGSRGADLTRGNDRVPSLDPVQASAVSSSRVVGLVYESLLRYGPQTDPYGLEPELAEALPRIGEDGRAYTFRLREKARFVPDPCFGKDGHGNVRGRPVRADDVVYSLKRLVDPRVASPGAWTLRDRLAGVEAFRAACLDGADLAEAELSGLEALDSRTVRIVLTCPSPRFLWILAMPYTAIVPREAVRYYGNEFGRTAVGSGPYRLESWRPNYRMRLRRRPEWPGWEPLSDRYPGRPFDRLTYLVIDDPVTEWLAFLTGMLDIQDDISRDNWDAVVDASGRLSAPLFEQGLRMRSRPALDVAYIGFNFRDPLLGTNRYLRAAMRCAFDGTTWERFHAQRVRRATGPVPPGVAGRLPDAETRGRFDLERARTLMRAAGYPGGIDPRTGRRLALNLEIGNTDNETRESTELLVAFMERIGIRLQPNYLNWPAFLARVSRGEAQLFRLLWLADYPDAENFLQLFYGPNVSPGPNRANYRNPEYDALYEAARATLDDESRRNLYRRLQQILQHDVPWLWMHHRVRASLYRERVSGFVPHDFPYGMEKFFRVREGAGGEGAPE